MANSARRGAGAAGARPRGKCAPRSEIASACMSATAYAPGQGRVVLRHHLHPCVVWRALPVFLNCLRLPPLLVARRGCRTGAAASGHIEANTCCAQVQLQFSRGVSNCVSLRLRPVVLDERTPWTSPCSDAVCRRSSGSKFSRFSGTRSDHAHLQS